MPNLNGTFTCTLFMPFEGETSFETINTEKDAAWKKVTEAVHKEGGKIFMQLWHVGRISHPKFHDGNKPLAPSAVNPNEKVYTPEGFEQTTEPKEMTIQEIQETVQEFKNASQMAKTKRCSNSRIGTCRIITCYLP